MFHTNHEPHIVNTIYDILYEYYYPDGQSNQIIRFEILELLNRLIRIASNNPVLQTQKYHQNINEMDTLTLLLYIEKNYKDVTLERMAKQFGFNPNYLSAFLKKEDRLYFH